MVGLQMLRFRQLVCSLLELFPRAPPSGKALAAGVNSVRVGALFSLPMVFFKSETLNVNAVCFTNAPFRGGGAGGDDCPAGDGGSEGAVFGAAYNVGRPVPGISMKKGGLGGTCWSPCARTHVHLNCGSLPLGLPGQDRPVRQRQPRCPCALRSPSSTPCVYACRLPLAAIIRKKEPARLASTSDDCFSSPSHDESTVWPWGRHFPEKRPKRPRIDKRR
ncbi:hypothetical protein GGTG_01697 [Gaeumannomyces tritici R3-111a-1]|uniref:Uncharacterized protein n=1 Tax=Gaeumannomyces tritici (strain R3-111a-1) TaxID=644352 RepID=J3NKB7_GAET3|nr:hypothetical protein GGTG_01697 [Gaeumannomyces tritici R3-111a-1]EJT81721.1 hypothetical protein GGTG_01697 [Gaeumannomyces tritici R3-111a-1]